jgi:hypothetical protein
MSIFDAASFWTPPPPTAGSSSVCSEETEINKLESRIEAVDSVGVSLFSSVGSTMLCWS